MGNPRPQVRVDVVVLAALGWLASMGMPSAALAADFKSVGDQPAILYDAPTLRGRKLSVAPRGMPVEIVVVQGDWDRVRDSSGEFSWIQKAALGDRRTLVSLTDATLHASADEHAPTVLRLGPGVLIDLLEPPSNGFAHVRHRDGYTGWVKVSEVWGL
jgi:hypothetical protein